MSVKKLLGAAAWKGLLLAVVTLLLLLAAAALMLQRGLVGESAASALVCAAYVAAVMIGGRSAIRSSSAPPLPQSLAVAVCLYAVVWLVAIGGETDFAAHGPLLTGAIFGGAVLAGLPGRKRESGRQGPVEQGSGRAAPQPTDGGDIKNSMVKITKFFVSPKKP